MKDQTAISPDPIEQVEPEYTFVHLRLPAEIARELDRIVAHLESNKEARRYAEKLNRAVAIRFAIGRCVEQLESGR